MMSMYSNNRYTLVMLLTIVSLGWLTACDFSQTNQGQSKAKTTPEQQDVAEAIRGTWLLSDVKLSYKEAKVSPEVWNNFHKELTGIHDELKLQIGQQKISFTSENEYVTADGQKFKYTTSGDKVMLSVPQLPESFKDKMYIVVLKHSPDTLQLDMKFMWLALQQNVDIVKKALPSKADEMPDVPFFQFVFTYTRVKEAPTS